MSTAHTQLVRGVSLITGLLLIGLCSGCSGAKPWDTVYPVEGKVLYKGKPVKDAELAFFPEDTEVPEAVRPLAKTNENGEFKVSTYGRDDGAPAGTYKVTVVHHEIVVSGGSMGTKPNDLPKKYASRDTTELLITVESAATTLEPFELK